VKKVALTLRLPPEIYKGAKEMATEEVDVEYAFEAQRQVVLKE